MFVTLFVKFPGRTGKSFYSSKPRLLHYTALVQTECCLNIGALSSVAMQFSAPDRLGAELPSAPVLCTTSDWKFFVLWVSTNPHEDPLSVAVGCEHHEGPGTDIDTVEMAASLGSSMTTTVGRSGISPAEIAFAMSATQFLIGSIRHHAQSWSTSSVP